MVKHNLQRASALIVTLLLVVLVTILLVGFLTTMRMEIGMSNAHLQGVQAGYFACMGTDVARARLLSATSGTNMLWTSAPGTLTVSGTNVELFSGSNASTNSADTVNLNLPSLEDQTKRSIAATNFFTDSTNPSMRVQWIYVDKTGAFGTAHSTNSIGRFAFWVDDESSKVNLNTAWKQGNPASNSDPSQVALGALGFTNTDSDTIHSNQPFNAVREAGRVASISESNLFQLSAYNHSPELNMFNEPRIILTTKQSLAGSSTNFLDILNSPTADPGLTASLDPAKVAAQVNKIAALLSRTNWPLPNLAGKSFADKYSPVSPHQIALNIIEYVRCCESPTPLVEPIRGTVTGGTAGTAGVFAYTGDPAGTNAIAGNVRCPRLTEFGIYVSSAPVGTSKTGIPLYQVKFKVEIFLPSGFGLTGVELKNYQIGLVVMSQSTGTSGYMGISGTAAITEIPQTAPATPRTFSLPWVESGSSYLKAGEYRVLDCWTNFDAATRSAVDITGVRVVLKDANGVRVELIPTSLQPIAYTPDPASVAEAAITTRSVDDPSLNKNYQQDWTPQKAHTLGLPNPNTLRTASTKVPQQDTDFDNKITDVSMRFPPPKGQPGNLNGIITSVAELGYVHTGIQTLITTKPGTPWRTIRLQPQNSTTTLPDWAMLDLFQVPNQSTTPTFSSCPLPDTTTTGSTAIPSPGGKVNLNTQIAPFSSSLQRTLPLQAVFQNVSNGSGTVDAPTLVTNIVQAKLASAGNSYGLTNYITPGQITEVRGIADTGEASEALLRNTVDHLTTRGGVYSIYTVGQSIRQNASGNIFVLGERRDVTVVERLQSTGTTHLRTVSTESLNP